MRHYYDYSLIDCPAGINVLIDILTVQIPDTLVDCFTAHPRSIEGAAKIAESIEKRYKHRGIRILPVPMLVKYPEKEALDASRAFARRLFSGLPDMPKLQRERYWTNVEVPYMPFYEYEELLAIFGDQPGSPGPLLSSYERLAAQITDGRVTHLPPIDEQLRIQTVQMFRVTKNRPVTDGAV